jgi:hypothetical protein
MEVLNEAGFMVSGSAEKNRLIFPYEQAIRKHAVIDHGSSLSRGRVLCEPALRFTIAY